MFCLDKDSLHTFSAKSVAKALGHRFMRDIQPVKQNNKLAELAFAYYLGSKGFRQSSL